MTLLDVADLTVRFGGLVAVDRVTMTLDEGEILGLIGPNGAGKTTLIDAMSGFERSEGAVRLLGTDLRSLRPDQRCGLGLGRTFQSLELFDDLTVGENVTVSGRANRVTDANAAWALALTGVTGLSEHVASAVSFAERRFVALARALATRPRVLLVDEVAAGLDADARQRVARCLREVADGGAGVILVDHALDLVLEVSHRIVVLDHGAVLASGAPSEIRHDASVIAAYLGPAL